MIICIGHCTSSHSLHRNRFDLEYINDVANMAYFTDPDYSEPYDDVLAIPWNILPTRDTAEVNWCRYEYDWKIARDLGGMPLVCGDMLYDGAEGSSTYD